ncbi:MAG: hypothetical protein ACOCYV_00075 [Planctomycetota bacterium]
MAGFRYKARNQNGEIVTGIVAADDLEAARLRVIGRGLEVITITRPVLKQAPPPTAPPPTHHARNLALALSVGLLIAAVALLWLDPYDWGWGDALRTRLGL